MSVSTIRVVLYTLMTACCLTDEVWWKVMATDPQTSSVVLLPDTSTLTLAVGDTLTLECRLSRVPTATQINWSWSQTKPDDSRLNITQCVDDISTGSGLQNVTSWMTLTKLSLPDSGMYQCLAFNATFSKNLSLIVTSQDNICGFESDSLCGWIVLSSWQRRRADDIVKYDHTYGNTSTAGSFMSAQSAAVMTSPLLNAHGQSKCFSFWLIRQGDIALNVSISAAGSQLTTNIVTIGPEAGDVTTWQRKNVNIDAQITNYTIKLSADPTTTTTTSSKLTPFTAVDDISLVLSDCSTSVNSEAARLRLLAKSAVDTNSTESNPTTVYTSVPLFTDAPIASPTTTQATVTTSTTSSTPSPTSSTTTATTAATTTTTTTTTSSTTEPQTSTATTSRTTPTTTAATTTTRQNPTTSELFSVPTEAPNVVITTVSHNDSEGIEPEVDSSDLAEVDSNHHAGLVLGITLAVMAAAACTAAILYRRRRRGKKSTYITFGNPSYSREHLPANDFTLDSPLTLSSNGYTVLA